MIKILYIVSTLGNTGPTVQLYNLIKYLDRGKFEPYILTLSPEPQKSKWHDFESMGLVLHSLKLSRIKGAFFAQKKVQTLINEIKPDIIHTQGFRPDVISSKLKTTAVKITTIHNFPQIDYIMEYGRILGEIMLIKSTSVFKRMSLCIGVSESVTNNLKKNINLTNASTVLNGVDLDSCFPVTKNDKECLRKKLGIDAKVQVFITLGNLINRKDPLFLITVWKKYFSSNMDIWLIVIGGGILYKNCLKTARDHKNIRITGRVENAIEYLQASDYIVSTSKGEGFPAAILEGMACGLPVLLSDIEPHSELVHLAPDIGLLYKLQDIEDFVDSIHKLKDSNHENMSKAAINIIHEKLNISVMSKSYQNLYEKPYPALDNPHEI